MDRRLEHFSPLGPCCGYYFVDWSCFNLEFLCDMPVEFRIFNQVTLVIFSLLVGAKLRTETKLNFILIFS